jgi:hypothetical protein
MVNPVNIANSFLPLVSGAPEIGKQQTIGIRHGSSGAPENTDLVCRFRNANSTSVELIGSTDITMPRTMM